MVVQYDIDRESKNVGLTVYPYSKESQVQPRKLLKIDSLVQLKLIGDNYGKGYSHGKSMRNFETTQNLRYYKQQVNDTEKTVEIVTCFKDKRDNLITHNLCWDKRYAVLETYCIFTNNTKNEEKIEMISSFSLCGISPFEEKNIPNSLYLNRFRSKWSMEGRLERGLIENYQLEPCWKPSGATIEKFGQIGSMPVRGYFPFACIEDSMNQVAWGVQLGIASSWQIEVYRKENDLCLSGGLADRDFGHWLKVVPSSGYFTTPTAYMTVCTGQLEQVTQRLAAYQEKALLEHLIPVEEELPIMFNEFCTTWGHPSEDKIRKQLEILKGKGIRYFVIDAGWHASKEKGWEKNIGDWVVSQELFPSGMKRTVQAIREAGMIPGIWFEFEVCGRDAEAFQNVDHLLKKDGIPITTGDRRYWDMRDPWVRDYLTEKVINFLKDNHFGYLKVDYNDNLGIGIDHPESLGEGLCEQIAATQSFFGKIKRELPEMVVENCASGGHRLVTSMMGLTDMSSFSDAHEATVIPIIAANLHSVMLPRQSLIWAVLRQGDSAKRLYYSMVNTFLGRMCLSGDVDALTEAQWNIVEKGIQFYKKVAPTIKHGNSYRFGKPVSSYEKPQGVQAVVRYHENGKEALLIAHSFEVKYGETLTIPLKSGNWRKAADYGSVNETEYKVGEKQLSINFFGDFQALGIYLICS
ncbi:MAG: hypothetical protein H6Q69_1206 [Firmicutes bacterium]|nr:hypothetical protein [Bacillota bacterium]